jgi:hypothetical protein
MRFPRIHRVCWDKPVGKADTLETVESCSPNSLLVRPPPSVAPPGAPLYVN